MSPAVFRSLIFGAVVTAVSALLGSLAGLPWWWVLVSVGFGNVGMLGWAALEDWRHRRDP